MSLEYTYFYHLKYHMDLVLHRTQFNVDVDDDTENEDGLIPTEIINMRRRKKNKQGQSCPST